MGKAFTLVSSSRSEEIIEAFLPFVWTCRPDGAMESTSPALLAYLGASQPEMLDRGWLDYVHPDDRERTLAAWRNAVTAGVEYRTDYRLRRHDGAYVRFDARAIRLGDEAGHLVEWFGRLEVREELRPSGTEGVRPRAPERA